MVRLRIVVIAFALLVAVSAEAQPGGEINGVLGAYLGGITGGDTGSAGIAVAGSMAVIESSGWGAEVELGHARGFGGDLFDDGEITNVMINALGMWPRGMVRPFGSGGIGALRVQAAPAGGGESLSRIDWGFDFGGGVMVVLNDAIGVRGDLRYFRYFQRHDDLPQSNDGYFDFWRTSIGITWSWPIR